jgi:hypothetical protein
VWLIKVKEEEVLQLVNHVKRGMRKNKTGRRREESGLTEEARHFEIRF